MDDCRLNVRRQINTDQFASLFHKHYVFVLPAPPGIFSEKRELDYSFVGVWTHCRWTWNDEMTWTLHIVLHCFTSFQHSLHSQFAFLRHCFAAQPKGHREIRIDKVYAVHILKWRAGDGSRRRQRDGACCDGDHSFFSHRLKASQACKINDALHQLHHMHCQKQLCWDIAMTHLLWTLKNSKEHDHHKILGRDVILEHLH